ncbi:Ig-like domain repeat protein [Candidatus Bathyarchaeota archaeon]|nr:Ig-like domain repeat protein [Candidatus Bathyarchaeota archaeon]
MILNSESDFITDMHKHKQKSQSVFNLKGALPARSMQKIFAIAMIAALLLMTLKVTVDAQVDTDSFPEYERYVHTDWMANLTYVEKPMFPVYLNESQVPIGKNWTVICPLQESHSYHVYCYGEWVHTGDEPKTDYDIYVYNPQGELEGTHTEAAGLPEHLGTTVDDAFFVPGSSGNYTFVIVNDARESNGAEQATFMIIENVEGDTWYTHSVTGKVGDTPAFNTSWAYEFITASPQIELWVRVPDTLDMYEARLYLMSNTQSVTVNNVSLPWEPGLYGNKTTVGGYNLESEAYRGVAYASCEYNGQDMFLNYSQPFGGENVYHLVLMGEVGEGNIEFLVKTSFGGTLTPLTFPQSVTPSNITEISYATNTTRLENASLRYTVDNWKNTTKVEMVVSNMTCNATIPQQEAGSVVEYTVEATDAIKNRLVATGNFTVKHLSAITDFNATRMTVTIGENITVAGTISAEAGGAPITVTLMSINSTETIKCTAMANGTFTATYQPETTGDWQVQASFAGNNSIYACESEPVLVTVQEQSFLVAYGLYIGGGVGGGLAAVGAVIYIKKYRG